MTRAPATVPAPEAGARPGPPATGPAPAAPAGLPAAGAPGGRLDLRMFWYVAARSRELGRGQVLGRRILDEPLALFRDGRGRPVALDDRCAHRAAPLSAGRPEGGRLRCGYHGWLYDEAGRAVEVPSLGPGARLPGRCAVPAHAAAEQDGYVYVRLAEEGAAALPPPRVPHLGEPGWGHVRLVNRFPADVTSCVENFVDIPHTAFVHAGLFRSRRGERLLARVVRAGGAVTVTYRNERRNLGLFAAFLNRAGREIAHTDRFLMPNLTSVEYAFGPARRFVITSQAVPVTAGETLVYTDLAYRYGPWTRLAGPVVRRLAQRIIDQDVRILGRQAAVLARGGAPFVPTPADVIHAGIESIRRELERGRDPRLLPARTEEIAFWV
jgi:phenylpropionate dioxygenase-like ring-hydroxylating dioxygenase large terminal subunit